MTDKTGMQTSKTPVSYTGRLVPDIATGASAESAICVGTRFLPWHTLAIVAILAMSAWFRLSELGTASLTHDEALRTNITYGGIDPVRGPRVLPPLRFVLGWVVQHGFGRTELAVRFPSMLAGIGCVVLLYLFARRYLGVWTAVLVAAVAGTHPVLVNTSRIVKVYSLESLLMIVLLWAGLEAYRHRSARSLHMFMVAGIIGLGFTYTSSLVIAAWFPLLAYAFLRHGKADRRLRRSFLVVTAVLVVTGAAWYVWLATSPFRDSMIEYQAVVLRAWPEAYTPEALGSWLLVKGSGLLRYVLGITDVWPPLKWCVGTVAFLAVAASVGPLWRQCRCLCVLGVILAVELVVAAALRMWPIGEYQTMTFLIPLFAIAMGCGLHHFVQRMGRSPAVALILGFCVLIPAARATKATLFPPQLEQHLRPVFAYTASHLEPDDAVFIHYETRDAYGFYWRDTGHPILLQPYNCRDNLAVFAGQFDPWIAEHRRVWFVFMLRRPNEVGPWMEYLKTHYHIRDEYRFNDVATYLIESKSGP